MSALAAGCRSGGRAGYSNAAVAYFVVALAFGLAALEEQRITNNYIIAESQSENLGQLVYSHRRYVELFGRTIFTFYTPTLPQPKLDGRATHSKCNGTGPVHVRPSCRP